MEYIREEYPTYCYGPLYIMNPWVMKTLFESLNVQVVKALQKVEAISLSFSCDTNKMRNLTEK